MSFDSLEDAIEDEFGSDLKNLEGRLVRLLQRAAEEAAKDRIVFIGEDGKSIDLWLGDPTDDPVIKIPIREPVDVLVAEDDPSFPDNFNRLSDRRDAYRVQLVGLVETLRGCLEDAEGKLRVMDAEDRKRELDAAEVAARDS